MGKTKCKRKVQHYTHHFPWTFAVHGKCGCVLLWTKKRRRNRASRDGLHQSDNLNRKPADGKWSASQRHRKQWFILFKQGRFHTNSWHLQNVFLTGMSLINWEKIQMLLTRYLACFGWVNWTDLDPLFAGLCTSLEEDPALYGQRGGAKAITGRVSNQPRDGSGCGRLRHGLGRAAHFPYPTHFLKNFFYLKWIEMMSKQVLATF